MTNEHKKFIKRGLEQLKYIFGVDEEASSQDNKELIMTTYMHIIAYAYDDREHIDKTDDEILEIARKTTKRDMPDSNVGKILRCKPNDAQRLNLLRQDTSKEGRKKWSIEFSRLILEKTRNAICHGCFNINDDGTITIDSTTQNNPFKITYNFDCLCDVCEELATKEQLMYYRDLLDKLKQNKKLDLTDSKNRLVYLDLLVNLLVSYNEDIVYSSDDIINRVNELYRTQLDLKHVKHIRNSVTHHYRCFSGDDSEEILILDYRDKNRDRMTSNFTIKFDRIIDFSKSFNINSLDSLLQNQEKVVYKEIYNKGRFNR